MNSQEAFSPPPRPHSTQPRYPNVQVQLSGEDGNAFAILGRTAAALRAAGIPQEEIEEFDDQRDGGRWYGGRAGWSWVGVSAARMRRRRRLGSGP
jgi:hypothetical protein